jgi:hypothetical protein
MWSSTFFDKSRNRTLTRLLAGEERLQLFGDDAVQHGLFRLARNILERSVQHDEASSSRAHARLRAAVLRELAVTAAKRPD